MSQKKNTAPIERLSAEEFLKRAVEGIRFAPPGLANALISSLGSGQSAAFRSAFERLTEKTDGAREDN
jgi:hypothetical protein